MSTTLELAGEVAKLKADLTRLNNILDSPETVDFLKGIVKEAGFQLKKWGSEHDEKKSLDDWLWLIAHLSTKASQASRYGDKEKYLHHIITCAAALFNWHRHALFTNNQPKDQNGRTNKTNGQ